MLSDIPIDKLVNPCVSSKFVNLILCLYETVSLQKFTLLKDDTLFYSNASVQLNSEDLIFQFPITNQLLVCWK